MKNIIKNFIVMPMLAIGLVAGSFAMFVQNVDAANVSLQAPVDTLRAANYSDCPTCIPWNAEGPTHATGDTSRPIVSLGIAYYNTGNETAQNVKVRLTPTSGNGGTTYFTGRIWADNASQLTGNATVTIPANHSMTFIGLYQYKNGSNNPISLNASTGSLSSGYSIGNVPAGDFGGVVARFEIEDNTPTDVCPNIPGAQSTVPSGYELVGGQCVPVVTNYDLDVNTLSAINIYETSAKLRGQVNSNGISGGASSWFEYATSANALSTNGTGQNAFLTSSDQHNASYSWLTNTETVTNLTPNTTYYYQICADNGVTVECDPYESFTTDGPTDVCPNIPGTQTSVPSGHELIGGQCVPIVQPTDVCPNIPGLQTSLPAGHQFQNGQCVPIVNSTPIEINTLSPQDLDFNSALLRGRVDDEGDDNVQVWFEWDTDYSDVANGNGSTLTVSGIYHQNNTFVRTLAGLTDDTTYYYRACGQDQNGNQDCGFIENFTTVEVISGSQNPDAITYNAQDEDEDSAELNGFIDMNDFNNGIVFFVYGQDESRIDDVDNDYNEYSDVDNDYDNDDFMNVVVDWNEDNSQTYSEDVNNLEEDEEYFFRICVEYDNNNNNPTLECGSTKSFDTDGNQGEDEPDVETDNPTGIDEDSAQLNGSYDMNDFNDGDIFFVWSDDQDDLDDVEDEDRITDVDNYANVEVIEYNADGSDNNVRQTITGLREDTRYYYMLCVLYEDADGDDVIDCGNVESFTTDDGYVYPEPTDRPIPGACAVTNIGVTSATFASTVNGNGHNTTSYFQYGTTTAFGNITGSSNTGSNTNIVSKFVSNLSPNTTYYCRIVSENSDGISYGDIRNFQTRSLNIINPERPVTIVTSGGTGVPIFLEIDDGNELAARGQTLQYDVRWENISGRDLDEVVLNVRLPKSVRFVSSTAGRYNNRDHNVTVDIGNLRAGEEDDMVIFVTVRGGTEGDQLVAEATIAFEDPQGETRGLLATIEYDVDTYTNGANGLLAGLFGIGFLPGIIGLLLAILLILIIILVARRVTEPRHTEYRG